MSDTAGRPSIFITGAASGIGKAVAKLFGQRGWFVGLFDIDETGLAQVFESMPAGCACYGRLDVTDPEQWGQAVQSFCSHTDGMLDFFFNNAGVLHHGWFEDVPPEHADHLIDVNVKGPINGIYATLPTLKKTAKQKGKARILNTASSAGLYGVPRVGVYGATKFAVRGLTESLDLEFSRYNIEVSDLMPGVIETPMVQEIEANSNQSFKDGFTSDIGATVNPVEMVAEEVWQATQEHKLHRTVGKGVSAQRFFSNHLRGQLRKRLMGIVQRST